MRLLPVDAPARPMRPQTLHQLIAAASSSMDEAAAERDSAASEIARLYGLVKRFHEQADLVGGADCWLAHMCGIGCASEGGCRQLMWGPSASAAGVAPPVYMQLNKRSGVAACVNPSARLPPRPAAAAGTARRHRLPGLKLKQERGHAMHAPG